jgi:hypothetical protein
MAEEVERTVLLRDHYVPSTYTSPSCLQLPNVTAAHYELKSSIIQMLPSFYGLNNEDPYKHLDKFLEICTTIKLQNFFRGCFKNASFSHSPSRISQVLVELLGTKLHYFLGANPASIP